VHTADRRSVFVGALLGLALGDACGAPLEGSPLEWALWRVIWRTRQGHLRWTDDTQMSLDLAESLIAHQRVDQDDLARRFARSYRWSRGYGSGVAPVLRLIRNGVDWRIANTHAFGEGSFGNGGAMRAPVAGLYCMNDLDHLADVARSTAVVTHAHPVGQEAAVLVAFATASAAIGWAPLEILEALESLAHQAPFRERLRVARSWLAHDVVSPDQVRAHLGNGRAATESCVSAVYIALRFLDRPFADLLQLAAACGGDVDTIGAIAGAAWGARNGDAALPAERLARLEGLERIRQLALDLHDVTVGRTTA
jgi:poly(ADP-ribose) glycohydrolase ARH3